MTVQLAFHLSDKFIYPVFWMILFFFLFYYVLKGIK
jgi:hypothetical protein